MNFNPIPNAIKIIPTLKKITNAVYEPEKVFENGFNKFSKYENKNFISNEGREDIKIITPMFIGKFDLFSIKKNIIIIKNKEITTEKTNMLFQLKKTSFSSLAFDKDRLKAKFPNIRRINKREETKNNKALLMKPIKNKC